MMSNNPLPPRWTEMMKVLDEKRSGALTSSVVYDLLLLLFFFLFRDDERIADEDE